MSHQIEIPKYVREQALVDDPGFREARDDVHDWRNHVGQNVQAMWATIPADLRLAIAADADESASREEWE